MGGSCCICGYNKCQSSLVLHHLDPDKKDFAISSIRANPKNWFSIVEELRKCVMLCHNCHCEVHEGLSFVPNNAPKFDEEYLEYRKIESIKDGKLTPCLVCGKLKPSFQKTCSKSCSARLRFKVDWDNIDLQKELKSKSILQLAKELGCSDGAIHKRLKKLGLK